MIGFADLRLSVRDGGGGEEKDEVQAKCTAKRPLKQPAISTFETPGPALPH